MLPDEIERLRYRRQYVISPKPLVCNFLHTTHSLTKTITLYAHVDLKVTIVDSPVIRLVLLGDIFDHKNIYFNNQDILHEIAVEDPLIFLNKISGYVGRFVLIYIRDERLLLVTDAAASRKVYYCEKNGGVYCASQPHLLAATLNIPITSNLSRLSFYKSVEFKRLNCSNIGNTTCYDEIFQLMPNHYLNHSETKSVRFWPDRKIQPLALDEVVNTSSEIIRGYINSIGYRYDLMLPVTGGKDSRLLLAATREIKDKVFYYINKQHETNQNNYDISIPQSLLTTLGLDFHIIDPYIAINKDFESIYFENNPFADKRFLPIIHNYYVNFSDKINLPGIFVNIAEDVYEVLGRNITPHVLAKLIGVEKFDYAVDYFAEWLEECGEISGQYNINVLNLLYWEERIANWGTQIQLDKDIAQEDIIPYNSRLLMQTMLAADLKYREKPGFDVFWKITCNLWPETLRAPCNPDFKTDVLKLSKALGIMKIIKKLYYKYFH